MKRKIKLFKFPAPAPSVWNYKTNSFSSYLRRTTVEKLPSFRQLSRTKAKCKDNLTEGFQYQNIYLIINLQASWGLVKAFHLAVGIPCRSRKALAKLVLDASWAAFADGPKHLTPAALKSSTIPNYQNQQKNQVISLETSSHFGKRKTT